MTTYTIKDLSSNFFPLLFLIVSGWSTSAACAESYVSARAGYVWLENADLKGDSGTGGEFSFDKGHRLAAAIGSTLSEGLRAELELGYQTNEASEVRTYNGQKSSVDADIVTVSLMANCFYDFIPNHTVSPFVGAGIGIAHLDGEIPFHNDQDTVFAYQLAVGLALTLSDTITIDMQYHFFVAEDPQFQELEGEYKSDGLLFGLQTRF